MFQLQRILGVCVVEVSLSSLCLNTSAVEDITYWSHQVCTAFSLNTVKCEFKLDCTKNLNLNIAYFLSIDFFTVYCSIRVL